MNAPSGALMAPVPETSIYQYRDSGTPLTLPGLTGIIDKAEKAAQGEDNEGAVERPVRSASSRPSSLLLSGFCSKRVIHCI